MPSDSGDLFPFYELPTNYGDGAKCEGTIIFYPTFQSLLQLQPQLFKTDVSGP